MKNGKKLWEAALAGLLSGLLALVLSGCGSREKPEGKAEPHVVGRVDILDAITQTGEVTPVVKLELRTEASGRIEKLLVKEGQKVDAGDTLLTIDASRLIFRKEQLELAVRRAHIQRDKVSRDLEQARALAGTGTVSEKRIRDLESDLELAKISHRQERLELEDILEQLSKTVVTAPMSGVLTELGVEEGEIVVSATSGFQAGTVIGTLADISQLEVRSSVGEVDYVHLEPGMRVRIEPEARQGAATHGTITFIAQSAKKSKEEELGRFDVRISIDSLIGGIVPGINVRVEFVLQEKKAVLGVPYSMVLSRGNKHMVRKLVGKGAEGESGIEAEMIPVKVGITDFRNYEIVAGLAEGDKVLPARASGGMGRPPGGGRH